MPWPVERVTWDLRRLGVAAGDVLMVHASLRAIGPVVGGAAGVVRALESAVGPTGTLLMVLGSRDDWDWVNTRPERERPALLADAPVFDTNTTPADPEVGVLAEVFRQLPGTAVNNHPDGRFGARGRLTTKLLAHTPWDDYYGPGCALDGLVAAGGKVLRMGADPDTVTLLHLAEYLAPVPDKRRITRHHKVTGPDGEALVRPVSCLDDCAGIVEWSGEDYFGLVLREYLGLGQARSGPVGDAPSELIDASDFLDYGVSWLTSHLTR